MNGMLWLRQHGPLSTLAGITLVVAGCTDVPWLAPTPIAPPPYVQPSLPASGKPAIQQTSANFSSQQARAEQVSRILLTANPQIAMRPRITVQATATPEITHQGDYRIIVSEGMVNACQTDGQLAAVLANELARMVVERQGRNDLASMGEDREPLPEFRPGADGGDIGGAQLYRAEAAKLGLAKRKPASEPTPPPNPEVLSRDYLMKAGYNISELDAVSALLRQRETK